jgi:hypothetical protein
VLLAAAASMYMPDGEPDGVSEDEEPRPGTGHTKHGDPRCHQSIRDKSGAYAEFRDTVPHKLQGLWHLQQQVCFAVTAFLPPCVVCFKFAFVPEVAHAYTCCFAATFTTREAG